MFNEIKVKVIQMSLLAPQESDAFPKCKSESVRAIEAM